MESTTGGIAKVPGVFKLNEDIRKETLDRIYWKDAQYTRFTGNFVKYAYLDTREVRPVTDGKDLYTYTHDKSTHYGYDIERRYTPDDVTRHVYETDPVLWNRMWEGDYLEKFTLDTKLERVAVLELAKETAIAEYIHNDRHMEDKYITPQLQYFFGGSPGMNLHSLFKYGNKTPSRIPDIPEGDVRIIHNIHSSEYRSKTNRGWDHLMDQLARVAKMDGFDDDSDTLLDRYFSTYVPYSLGNFSVGTKMSLLHITHPSKTYSSRPFSSSMRYVFGNDKKLAYDEKDVSSAKALESLKAFNPALTQMPDEEVKRAYYGSTGVKVSNYANFLEAPAEKERGVLDRTNRLFKEHKIATLISRFHTTVNENGLTDEQEMTDTAKSKVYGNSHGRNLLKLGARDGANFQTNDYDNPYCRVWTYHHQYDRYSRLIRPFTTTKENEDGTETISVARQSGLYEGNPYATKYEDGLTGGQYLENNSVLGKNGLVNIAPSRGGEDAVEIKKCMFSIENLAWKDVPRVRDYLDESQRGPNGGRIMWFPPYDLDFQESVHVDWNSSKFIGRGESVYTYSNTERTGTLSFSLLIDHPSIIDNIPKRGLAGMAPDNDPEGDILRFFAGCGLLGGAKESNSNDPITPPGESLDVPKEVPSEEGNVVKFYVYYPNNYSGNAGVSDATKLTSLKKIKDSNSEGYGTVSEAIDHDWWEYLLCGRNAAGVPGMRAIAQLTSGTQEEEEEETQTKKWGPLKEYWEGEILPKFRRATHFHQFGTSAYQFVYFGDDEFTFIGFANLREDEIDSMIEGFNDFLTEKNFSDEEIDEIINCMGPAFTELFFGENFGSPKEYLVYRGSVAREDVAMDESSEFPVYTVQSILAPGQFYNLTYSLLEDYQVSDIDYIADQLNAHEDYKDIFYFDGLNFETLLQQKAQEEEDEEEDGGEEPEQPTQPESERLGWVGYEVQPMNGNNPGSGITNMSYVQANGIAWKENSERIPANNEKGVSMSDISYGYRVDWDLRQKLVDVEKDLKTKRTAIRSNHNDTASYELNSSLKNKGEGATHTFMEAVYALEIAGNTINEERKQWYTPYCDYDATGTTEKRVNQLLSIFKGEKGRFTISVKGGATEQDAKNTLTLAVRRANAIQKYMQSTLKLGDDVFVDNSKEGGRVITLKNLTDKSEDNSLEAKQKRFAVVEIRYGLPEIANVSDTATGDNPDAVKDQNAEDAVKKVQEEEKKNNLEVGMVANDADSTVKRRYEREDEYFKKLKVENAFLYEHLTEKFKYFTPAFHSISPEGFNARLTFLQQCTRQGHTIESSSLQGYAMTAGNLSFGRMPVCVLRIGDFLNTKVLINSVTINYSPGGATQWDLNPEGIGVQPMYAKVSLGLVLLGGQSLSGPVNRLQNAVSFNYYANTGVYDDRSDIAMPDEGTGKDITFQASDGTDKTVKVYGSGTKYKHIWTPNPNKI